MSSVYFWDLDDGFAGVVLLKKSKSGWLQCGAGCEDLKTEVHVGRYTEGEE